MKKMITLLLVTLFTICMLEFSAYASDVVMTVNGTEYTDHGTGWSDAIKLSKSGTETTVKLFADWIADSEKGFVCPDGGTKDGALQIESCKITVDLNGYTIDRNAPEDATKARVFYVKNGTFVLNDSSEAQTGVITGGRSDDEGGGVCLIKSNFVMNGGTIKGNRTKSDGGAVSVAIDGNDLDELSNFTMNGGVIEENYAESGGGIYIDALCRFTMNGGIIRNNRAYYGGGAIYGGTHYGDYTLGAKVEILGGSLIGNVSEHSYGGAINLTGDFPLILINCTITGNSAPEGCGGAIYLFENGALRTRHIVFGGKVNVTGNTGHTYRVDKTSNIEGDFLIAQALGMDYAWEIYVAVPNIPLSSDSKIGLNVTGMYNIRNQKITQELRNRITKDVVGCFTADNPFSTIVAQDREDGFVDLLIGKAAEPVGEVVMSVETSEGKKDFIDFEQGWVYVTQQSKTKEIKVTLHADWIGNGKFVYKDDSGDACGTKYATNELLISSKYNITIDLNGHTISRNAVDSYDAGNVFYIDTNAVVTFMDSSEAKTGKVTGAINGGNGGAFYVNKGTLRLDGIEVSGNVAKYGAGVYVTNENDSFVYVLPGTRIKNNTATSDGGGIYMNNGCLYVEGGEITDNSANKGAGVHWASNNKGYFTSGKIYGNTAKNNGGGVYVADYGKIFVGGDVQITDNEVGNLYISNKDRNIHNACGQDGSPNKPLTEGAIIGISSSDSDDLISGDDSRFKEGDYKYFHSDDAKYFIRSVYDASNANHAHKLYINSWSNSDVRNPRVKTVSVKNSDFLESVAFDYDSQSITLTAHNTRRDFFEYISLDSLIECTYDADTDYIYEMDYMRDLRNVQEYKVMSDNGTYTLCTVEVVPEGGEWADEQESVDNPYKMTVTVGSSVSGFTDFGEGWVYATSQTLPTTVTLFDDWFAPGGKFEYSSGTNKGRLYVNNKDVTIDLNGNTINRNLEEATSDGQVFRIAGSSKLTIVDNSATGNGKITGGNNNGNGGAFYIDSGSLHINGGEISGNYATNGAAVYWRSGGNLCITGGVITNNLAKDNGGAVYITNNGKVYFGGTAVIKNSSRGNVYISDKDANIYHAKGQADGVPDMPLTEGACIGIYASYSDDTISGDNSRFGEDDHKYFFSDSTDHYIRAVYKEGDGNHAYKLYINALTNSETKFPAIESVAVINSELLQSATVNNNTKVITLTGYANKKSSFEQVTLASLISYTFNSDATSVSESNALYNLSTPTDYKVMSDNGTYTVYTVVVEWVCSEHADEDNNHICDYCGEYITTSFAIPAYDAETLLATVITPEEGTYTVIFVDYEGGGLENVDIVNYEFSKGVNIVGQEILGFKLGKGDKIMLVSELITLTPLCKALVIE